MAFYNFKAPSLPLQPTEYDQGQLNQLANALRLYFNRLDSAFLNLAGSTGGAALEFPYGSFYDDTVQTAAVINTGYPITLNTTVTHNNIDIDPTYTSRMVASVGGVYNFQVSIQMTNQTATSTNGYVWIWGAKNGVDLENSASKVEISGTAPDEVHYADTFVVGLQPDEYFEVYWATDNLDCKLLAEAATAFAPGVNSINITATCVSAVYA
jgi:hypothetical protein